MSTSHFLVSAAALSGWQFSHKGHITGPFDNKQEAINAAIIEAEGEEDPDAEVMVQDADLKLETVWRPQR